jgi:hypothetical protein
MAFRRRLIMRIAVASRSHSSACDRPPACAMSCLTPPGSFEWHMAGRRPASALSWRCFPVGHHQLQHPRPTADPAVPSSPSNALGLQAPPPRSRNVPNNMRPRKNISDGPSGRSWCRYCTEIVYFKGPLYMAFPTAVDPADRAVGPLSPSPCQGWHGYGVSNAHHGEVRGCRRASERTTLRGRRRCAAGGRRNGMLVLTPPLKVAEVLTSS